MPFFTRPNFEDRQVVQYSGDTITLSGATNISNIGYLQINAPIVDFTGTTIYNIAGIQGYIDYGQPSSFIVQPPIILQSGTTGTTTVDVTGYILAGLDSTGRVSWFPASYFLTGGTTGSTANLGPYIYTDSTSASIIPLSGSNITEALIDVILNGVNNKISGTTSNGSSIINGNTGIIYKNRFALIGGGAFNTIIRDNGFASHNTIVNGRTNSIYSAFEGQYNFIGSGLENSISGNALNHSFIGNGERNVIAPTGGGVRDYSTILNGNDNLVRSHYGLILNGLSNSIDGSLGSTIINGEDNEISISTGKSIILSGIFNRITYPGTVPGFLTYDLIGSGSGNTIDTSTYSSINSGIGNEINFSVSANINSGGYNLISNSDIATIVNGVYNTVGDSDYSTIINGTYNLISGFTGTTIIGGNTIIAAKNDTTYVPYLNLNSIPTSNTEPLTQVLVRNTTSGNVEYVDSTSFGGGGNTIDPYYQVGTGDTFTWVVSGGTEGSTNYETTISANTTVNLTNVVNGHYGTLIVHQDSVGSRTLTFGTVNGGSVTHRVVNGGGGSPTLTATANAIDILSFTYNGSNMFWTVGNDYT
jgi:hypothetical protein